jgi:WD40 repeat protein
VSESNDFEVTSLSVEFFMAEVFISYSRKDKDFVQRLGGALAAHKREAWVDWKDIPLTAVWQQEIFNNIEAADNFLFVISPESVASANCRKEIDHAAANNKRMVPIFYRSVPDDIVPEALSKFQRIDFGDDAHFESEFAALVKALDTDLAWVQTHTRLLARAKEWEQEAKDKSFLLRGKDLRDAERWMAKSGGGDPKPTALHSQYILLSRQVATKLQRIIFGAVAVTSVIAVGLTVYAFMVQRLKEDALARSLSGKSASILNKGGDTELAGLLALESVKRSPTDEGAQALRNALVYLRKTRTFFGSGTSVSEIAFSPDSKRLVTVGGEDDPVARVYDVDRGRELLRLRHDGEVMDAAFGPDGQVLLTGSKDNTARVWDASSGRELHRLQCGSKVSAVAMSKQGLAGTGSQTAGQVWDLQTGRELARLEHPKEVRAVAFSPGGRWFASGGRDGSLQVWDSMDGQRRTLPEQAKPIRSLAFSPAEESHLLIAAADSEGDGSLQIVDVTNGKILAQAPYSSRFPPRNAIFSTEPNKIVVSGEGHASVWDAHLSPILRAHVETVLDEAFLSVDARLLITFHRPTLGIWDLREVEPGKELARIPCPDDVNTAELSPDGRLLAIGGQHTSRILELHPRIESARLTNLGIPWHVRFSADGRWAAIASQPVWIMDLSRPWEAPRSIATDADMIAMDRTGDRVVTGTQIELAVWDAHTGKKLGSADLPGGKVPAPLGFSADSTRVLFSLTEERLKAFEWVTGTWSGEGSVDNVYAINGDARLVAVRPDDHSIKILEMDTQREIGSLSFNFAPFEVGFGGNDKLLITVAQAEGLAQVWDLKSSKELAQVSGFGRISSAAISPNGRLVATVDDDKSVRFELWRTDDLIRYACELITRPLTHDEWGQYLPEDKYKGLETCPQFKTQKGR